MEYVPVVINIFLLVSAMTWVNWDFIKNHREFWESIKGKVQRLGIP